MISQLQKLLAEVIYTREICPTFRPGFYKIAKLKYLLNKEVSKLQINHQRVFQLSFSSKVSHLKEQYPVTAHAPNFDFWTGCREIERYEESKRTLKYPFASRLAEFNTTLKLLGITDQ